MRSSVRFSMSCFVWCALATAFPFASAAETTSATATLVVRADKPGATISRHIYGQFAEHLGHCIYEGIWVGEGSAIPNTRGIRNDVVAALIALKVPQLRWPGGCFADEYHWKDGIGPREQRPSMINTHWGGVVENNHFGTHEFLDFCEMIGADPYVCGNVGSGTVQEMMEWVEYMTSAADSPMANLRRRNGREAPWKIPFFAVGNESWGCGGRMRPEFYADQYRRYNTFVKNYPQADGSPHRIYRVACGPNGDNYAWTETLMQMAGREMDGLALHYYTLPTGDWNAKGSSTDFAEDQWFSTLRRTLEMETLITRHSAIMDKHDPEKRVGLVVDEWGTWYDRLPDSTPGFLRQQNTMRDAIVAALNLHLFHAHADRVTMANIAQMINVLQAMILTDKERMILTPTYHLFEMFNVHQDATFLPVELDAPDYVYEGESVPMLSASASRDSAGRVHVSIANTDPHRKATITCTLAGVEAASVAGRVLTAPAIKSFNTFDAPDLVRPEAFTGASLSGGTLTVNVPAKAVVVLELR